MYSNGYIGVHRASESEMDVFVVPLTAFRACLDTFQPTPNHAFAERAQWLLTTYRCFTDPNAGPPPSRDPVSMGRRRPDDRKRGDRGGDRGGGDRGGGDRGGGGGRLGRHHDQRPPREPDRWRPLRGTSPPAVKPRIGPQELSEEQQARKEFLGILNKLSASNATTLIARCAERVRPEFADAYLDLFWEAFLRSADYQPFQVALLTMFQRHFPVLPALQARIHTYWTNRQWWPTVTLPNEGADDYNEFCDYVKWKKRILNTLNAWDVLAAHGWALTPTLPAILAEMLADFQATAPESPKILETIAEQILLAVRLLTPRGGISDALTASLLSVSAASFPPAVRFKWYDLQEVINAHTRTRAGARAPIANERRWKNDPV